ncbi:TPA: hypothetical protein ACGBIO_000773 [Providencia rettgeri]|nr:hypothetical protein [Providencia stuartii]
MNKLNPQEQIEFNYSKDGVIVITTLGDTQTVSYESAITALDNGLYDRDLPLGFSLVGSIADSWMAEIFTPTTEQRVILFRWIVSSLFVQEQTAQNGTRLIENSQGEQELAAMYISDKGAITIYPASERMLLATHIESVAFQKYGKQQGSEMIINMYFKFIDQSVEKSGKLTEVAQQELVFLHDELIDSFNTPEFNSTPVIH